MCLRWSLNFKSGPEQALARDPCDPALALAYTQTCNVEFPGAQQRRDLPVRLTTWIVDARGGSSEGVIRHPSWPHDKYFF